MATDVQSNNESYKEEFDSNDGSQCDNGNDSNDQQNSSINGGDNDGDGDGSPKFIRLRGLPWSATNQEILDFLKNVNVIDGSKGIHLVTSRWDGKNTGEAYVEVESQADVDEALKLYKASMGHRYIEVFVANAKEAKEAMRHGHGMANVVKLRGLPYSVTEQQIEEFFKGLEIKPDREGILILQDRRGRATGEAYVQFESEEDTEQALGLNREKIGHRYIEIFRGTLAELKRATSGYNRPGPYDLKDRGGNRNNDFNGGRNMRGDWGNGGGFGANNPLGFGNLPNFGNNGNFGNFGNNDNFGSFGNGGNNGGGNFGNFGNFGNGNNGNGGGGFGSGGGNSRSSFGNDFGDFGNFGNNSRGGSNNGGGNFSSDNFGTNSNGRSNFGNFGNFGNGINGGGGGGFNSFGNSGNFGPIGGGRNDSEYFLVHMRGLPYSSYENDVFKFFDPIRPAHVRINYNKKGQHSGTADTYFDTYEDAQLAMKRHRNQMGSRYIELFFDGKTNGNNSGGGGSGGGNNYNNNRRI